MPKTGIERQTGDRRIKKTTARPGSCRGSAIPASVHVMSLTNKDGQAIGRKGAESRARLLEAARALLFSASSQKLTASAIARAAGLASQTFYVYFDDIDEILHVLASEASTDNGEVIAELDQAWDFAAIHEHAERVVGAFYRYWDRHRPILNIRNFRAESGQEAFMRLRNESAHPVVSRIASRILASHGAGRLPERDAFARAVVIYAAIERMAARYASGGTDPRLVDSGDLKRAEVDILALMFSPPDKEPLF